MLILPKELQLIITSYIKDVIDLLYISDYINLHNLDYFTLLSIKRPELFPINFNGLYTIERHNWKYLYFSSIWLENISQIESKYDNTIYDILNNLKY